MTNPDVDPFSGGDSAPSLSFKDKPIGTVRTVKVTEAATLVQSRDFETGKPAFWSDGNKKMSAVVNGEDEQGDPVSVWASKPSALFTAIKDAQAAVEAGYRLKPGDTLLIKYTGDKPNSNPRLNAQKLYAAKVTPGTPPPAEDPWANDSASLQKTAQQASGVPGGFDDEPPF